MSAAACKIIINMLFAAILEGLSETLLSPVVRGADLSPEKADAFLARLAMVEANVYDGGAVESLQGIVAELVACGVYDETVWRILARPA